MRIGYLELKNYRRFRELKLQFPDGVVGILGLNGVGKSTIIEAIAWALFGNVEEVVRTSREGIRRAGAGDHESCSAVLEFELAGTEYRVSREMGGRNLSMRAELRTNKGILAEGDKPVKNMIQKLIGMDHKSFFTSVFAIQKELNALQKVSASERKKAVLRMLRIDGIDDVLAAVRADKRDAVQRIQGAERTLFMEDGREREKVLSEMQPDLTDRLDKATRELETAEQEEKLLAELVAAVRQSRDELGKDVEAYNSALGELKARRSALDEMRAREKRTKDRIAEGKARLQKLPALEKDELDWKSISEKKESMELEKARAERAAMIRKEIDADEAEETRRLEELAAARKGLGSASEMVSKIDEVEKAKTECQTSTAEISGRIGELTAKAKERRIAAQKDAKKLEEIKSAGRDGVCPTCERPLEDAYELLLKKLTESSVDADKEAGAAEETIAQLKADLKGLAGKEEALRKKRANLDQQLNQLRQRDALIERGEEELRKLRDRLARRKKELGDIGEVRFDDAEYRRLIEKHERLRQAHDAYLKLKSVESQVEQYLRDLDDVAAAMTKAAAEEEQYRGIALALEPKKSLYDSTVKELDRKTASLTASKDGVRKLSDARQRAAGDLERATKELDEISRVKKTIEEDRRKTEDLADLEDVVANFKDHLIGRVRPLLSELASNLLESMTEGRYSSVSLDEDYEMQIEDQGALHPVSRYSGGEADLANLSLRLGISRIIADRTGAAPINFLILDEIFGSQDPIRKRSVMAALSKLSGQFRQILLITHIEDIKDSTNYVIRVEELEDGTSRAELAA